MQDLLLSEVFDKICCISFGFYTPEEIRKISVKQITCPQTYDKENKPIPW